MNSTAYKLLGYVVWNGGKIYLRRTHPWALPSRRRAAATGAAALLLAAGVGAALAARTRS
jgi:hypothetical protein